MTTLQRASTPQPGPGDLTGRRSIGLAEQKQEHERARERAIRDLNEGHGYQYISVPGHGLACIPKDVFEYLKKELAR